METSSHKHIGHQRTEPAKHGHSASLRLRVYSVKDDDAIGLASLHPGLTPTRYLGVGMQDANERTACSKCGGRLAAERWKSDHENGAAAGPLVDEIAAMPTNEDFLYKRRAIKVIGAAVCMQATVAPHVAVVVPFDSVYQVGEL